MKLDHIGIEVLDLFTVELFYRIALGFAPRYRYVSTNSPGLRTVFLERDGIRLERDWTCCWRGSGSAGASSSGSSTPSTWRSWPGRTTISSTGTTRRPCW